MRELAERVESSKSSVHRHLQAKERRNKHPESSLWETEAGNVWIRLLVLAALYCFGIKSGIGAETLSEFFKMIRINTHVGVSPSALRRQMARMEELLPRFQEECEKSVAKKGQKIVAGLDETFLGEFLILVLMDLSSGYLLLETITEDRKYETWSEKTMPRLEELDIEVKHAISDRAKALVKMAETGFECESGADVFHAQQDVSRLLGAKIGKGAAKAEKQLAEAKEKEEKIKETTKEARVITLKTNRVEAEKELEKAQKIQADYHENLQGIADEIHPFSLRDSSINKAEEIEERLELRAKALTAIAKEADVVDKKNKMKKFRNQFESLAISVDFWWLFVQETLQKLAIGSIELENWLMTTLLPVVYWHHKMQQTKNRRAKEKYRKAWEQALALIQQHPFSTTLSEGEIEQWLLWAINMAQQFQRSSSAVEGRNGCLSQMYRNGRGLDKQRLSALTVIHNYDLKRKDGTTAATRLFDVEFPDLFSWLLDKMGELPLPRKGREQVAPHPLMLLGVPS